MFLTHFQAFMTNNPSALWQATLLQRQVSSFECFYGLTSLFLLGYSSDDESKFGCGVLGEEDGTV